MLIIERIEKVPVKFPEMKPEDVGGNPLEAEDCMLNGALIDADCRGIECSRCYFSVCVYRQVKAANGV